MSKITLYDMAYAHGRDVTRDAHALEVMKRSAMAVFRRAESQRGIRLLGVVSQEVKYDEASNRSEVLTAAEFEAA